MTPALGPLLEEIGELRERFEHLPSPTVPLSDDQFAACVEDAQILALANEALREAAWKEIGRIRELSKLAAELARFAPPQLGAELQATAMEASRQAAEAIKQRLETTPAGTIEEVRSGEELLQAALDSLDSSAEDALARARESSAPDLDARIALVLGKDGSYTDELGFIHPGRVFGAFAEEGSPFERLGQRAAAYFDHLLPDKEPPPAAALLILPAVTLASLDRPFFAHRRAGEMVELLATALARDAGEVHAVVEQTTNEGPRVFAAASRIHKGMRLILAAIESDTVDDELALREVMITYQELAESAYRAYGWAVLELEAIAAGKSASGLPAPTLGQLKQRLEGSDSSLALALGEACDPALRNASGHSQYRWDGEGTSIEDLKTGRRWSLEELAEKVDSLVNAVVGVDAGYCCFALGENLAERPPARASSGHSPEIVGLLGEAIFSASGYEVLDLVDGGADVMVASAGDRSDLTALMTALASLSMVIPDEDAYRIVEAATGQVLLDVSGESMRAATGAPEQIQDLAILASFCDSAARVGGEDGAVARQSLALQAKIVAVGAMHELASTGATGAVLTRVRARAESVREFARQHEEIGEPILSTTTRRLERIVAGSYGVEREERRALEKLVNRIEALFSWAEEEGVIWPPPAPDT